MDGEGLLENSASNPSASPRSLEWPNRRSAGSEQRADSGGSMGSLKSPEIPSTTEPDELKSVLTRANSMERDPSKVSSEWRPKILTEGLGTVFGVFVPCMLSIIGVILFERLGWAVGQAGVIGVLIMFGIGGGMALLTVLSLSAMATNGKIAAGGTYYLVSRSVGPELGGAIGCVFFAANTVGAAFYLQGFAEVMISAQVLSINHNKYWLSIGMGSAVLLVEAVIAIVGTKLYSNCAFLIFLIQMFSIGYGLVGLMIHDPFEYNHEGHDLKFLGPSWDTFHSNLYSEYEDGHHFATVFGIIFPAMTGIMAGTNMSGVLKRPDIAIPRGELSAIFSAIFTYVIMVLAIAASCPRHTLKKDYYILARVCWWSPGLVIGIIASTTSSALASLQSGCRLMQALASDKLLPLSFFESTWHGEPVRALLLCVGITQGVLMMGSIDVIAPILTMFFLLTYATTNFATFVHRVSGHPNFRPRFHCFSWHTALLGGVTCLVLMFFLSWESTLVALVVFFGLAVQIHRLAPQTDWGDVSQSLIFHQVRSGGGGVVVVRW